MNKLKLIKENIEKYESDLLSDLDILTLILGQNITNELENNDITTISKLRYCSDNELLKMDGIGKENLLKIKAIIALTKRNHNDLLNIRITSPKDLYSICEDMQYLETEHLRLMCLNTKNLIIKNIDLFKGGIDTSIVDIRVLMKEVLKNNSTSFAIAHNHPSGNCEPSKEDLQITKRVTEAGKLLGCQLIDHIIIGKNCFISFKEKGYL